MTDFFEIDFLDVESPKSGDAITIRYQTNGQLVIHVVDGGFQATGESVVAHIRQYYGNPRYIDRVIVTHPDGDHAGGLRAVLENFEVGELWMLRPWMYADELIDYFARYTSVENLKNRLREVYPNIAALEDIALDRGIPIFEPFQGAQIGEFNILAPSRESYLQLIVESERTPESIAESERTVLDKLSTEFSEAATKLINFLRAAWGEETFSPNETSAENEMSVVQYAFISNRKILLTGDAGRRALTEAADHAPTVGLSLPGIDRFQVPHHGSRRNVSTEILDRWLGPRLASQGEAKFTALISSALKDKDHPRKAVVRALIHRGANVHSTEGKSLRSSCANAPKREGWISSTPALYPEEQED